MATLTRTWRWERFEPDLGDNLSLPEKERLSLRIASGLTAERLQRFRAERERELSEAKTSEAAAEALVRVLDGIVELEGTHTVGGKPVASLRDFVGVLFEVEGVYNLTELVTAVEEFNSVQGTQRLFSQRHSGGLLTTRAQSAAKAASPTDGR